MSATPRFDSETGKSGYHNCSSRGDKSLDEFVVARQLATRFNNELTSTIHLANMLASETTSDDVKDALAVVIQHVNDSTRVHRALHTPSGLALMDAATYIRDVCRAISLANLQYLNIALLLREAPLRLPASYSWRVGVIISEFISNASRHNFNDSHGRIQVELRECGPNVECTVSDNGLTPKYPTRLKLRKSLEIVSALARDIDGKVFHRFDADGAIARLVFRSPTSGELIKRHKECVVGNRD